MAALAAPRECDGADCPEHDPSNISEPPPDAAAQPTATRELAERAPARGAALTYPERIGSLGHRRATAAVLSPPNPAMGRDAISTRDCPTVRAEALFGAGRRPLSRLHPESFGGLALG
ncbi:hypothetical protein GCM10022236_41680 [Microlunatus ginsengisoli]|uniref:Uncharacterized protein n=1 Tax=Microlunatus ginsengisoli TaxID=363863 RepID=A0ABP7AL04_9ACTN